MLNRIRAAVTPLLRCLGWSLWRLGVTPSAVTLTGLLLSLTAPCFALLGLSWVVLVLLVVSLACDLIDGAVAKASNQASPKGALMDSVSDRVEELMFSLSLGFLGVEWFLVMLFLGTSFLTSYLRAIASQHSINLEGVGFMERGERGLLTAASLTLLILVSRSHAEALITLGVFLNTVTIMQRLKTLSAGLSKGQGPAP